MVNMHIHQSFPRTNRSRSFLVNRTKSTNEKLYSRRSRKKARRQKRKRQVKQTSRNRISPHPRKSLGNTPPKLLGLHFLRTVILLLLALNVNNGHRSAWPPRELIAGSRRAGGDPTGVPVSLSPVHGSARPAEPGPPVTKLPGTGPGSDPGPHGPPGRSGHGCQPERH
eukprot:759947-Hanusia_phi.AAC.1